MSRKIIQIAAYAAADESDIVVVLCDDGTVWAALHWPVTGAVDDSSWMQLNTTPVTG